MPAYGQPYMQPQTDAPGYGQPYTQQQAPKKSSSPALAIFLATLAIAVVVAAIIGFVNLDFGSLFDSGSSGAGSSGAGKTAANGSGGARAQEPERANSIKASGDVLIDDDLVTLKIGKVTRGDYRDDVILLCEVVNKSGKDINILFEGVSIDDLMIDAFMDVYCIVAGKSASCELRLIDVTDYDDLGVMEGTVAIIDDSNFDTLRKYSFSFDASRLSIATAKPDAPPTRTEDTVIANLDGRVLIDNKDVTITLGNVVLPSYQDCLQIECVIVNHGDKDIRLFFDKTSANGFMESIYILDGIVLAGKTSKQVIWFATVTEFEGLEFEGLLSGNDSSFNELWRHPFSFTAED
jgi:hypothetical protein